jgi:hypothetical protein
MNTRFLLAVICWAAALLGASPGTAATIGGSTHMSAAPAAIRPAPAVTHTAPATTPARSFRDRSRVVIVDAFGFPFFPYWSPYWYGYYPYGYNPYGYYYYNPTVYRGAYRSGSVVVEVQRRLARAGYYHGAIDGVVGARTRAAIRAYERAHGLRVDGVISRQLTATMGLRE